MSIEEPTDAPPAGEEIHMPDPSIIPILNAFGLAVVIIGITLTWPIIAVGGVIFLVTLAIWIRDAARELDSLPAEHH